MKRIRMVSWKALSKKKGKRLLLIAALLLLVLAATYTVFIAPLLEKEQWVYKEETVERGTLKVGVTESGSLEYHLEQVTYEVDLSVAEREDDSDEEETEESDESTQKYLKIAEVYVATGQRISQGDALMKFTEDSVEDVRALLKSALVDAQTDYNDAEAEYRLSALEAETQYEIQQKSGAYAAAIYESAKAAVDNEITIMEVELAQRKSNIASLQEKIEDARKTYQDALEEYNSAKATRDVTDTGHAGNFITVQNLYINAQTKYENAKNALEQAEQNLKDNAEEIASLEWQITDARARRTIDRMDAEETYLKDSINGNNAEVTYNAAMESLQETLEEAEQEKTKIEEQMAAFEEFVGDDGILYAKEAGILTEVVYEAGDRLENMGALLSYATNDNMTISVDVTQEDIVDLQVGDRVDITFMAYEDTIYEGTIASIDTTATAENTNTVSYHVVINVTGDTEFLYGGMTADIVFVKEQREDTLYISRKAIVEENGKSYVYVKTALGGMELKEVETGISNGMDIEILAGLEEGDTIYLASRVTSEDEVKSSLESEAETEISIRR